MIINNYWIQKLIPCWEICIRRFLFDLGHRKSRLDESGWTWTLPCVYIAVPLASLHEIWPEQFFSSKFFCVPSSNWFVSYLEFYSLVGTVKKQFIDDRYASWEGRFHWWCSWGWTDQLYFFCSTIILRYHEFYDLFSKTHWPATITKSGKYIRAHPVGDTEFDPKECESPCGPECDIRNFEDLDSFF